MRINHNIAALNTYSRLSSANGAQAKSLEKLSSGQRVNRAGDDAAGLAISEKMRAQIRGLNQASRNAQDGISMIQTAEGALNETHSILQRMRELAVQAANSTYTDADRSEIQKEVNQLSSEVNRIAGTTEFNKQALLDGGQAAGSVKGATAVVKKAGNDAQQAQFTFEFNACIVIGACDIAFQGAVVIANSCTTFTCTSLQGSVAQFADRLNQTLVGCWEFTAVGNTITAKAVAGGTCDGCLATAEGLCFAATCDIMLCTNGLVETLDTRGKMACAQEQRLTLTNESIKEGVTINVGNCTLAFWNSSSGNYLNAAEAKAALGVDEVYDIYNGEGGVTCAKDVVTALASCATITGAGGGTTLCIVDDTTLKITSTVTGSIGANNTRLSVNASAGSDAAADNGLMLQIGANTGQSFTLTFGDMTGSALKIATEASGDSVVASNGKVASFTTEVSVENNGTYNQYSLDVSTTGKASGAISVIEDAITAVSAERSKMGAYQNRLEHTIANLDTSSENLTAAESRIRDVDMAKEMMEFTKNNILNQAATAMLAQANQQPQGVLQLLR